MGAEDYTKEGYNQLMAENYPLALNYFQQAVSQSDTEPDSLYGLARAHFKLENYVESIDAFDRLINLLPNNATYLSERGVALHWIGDNRLALEDFDRAVDLEPDNPYRYSSRAYIKDRLGDYQGAIEDYTRTIEIDPEDAIAYNNRGLVEEKLGYQKQAEKSFRRADQLDQRYSSKFEASLPPISPAPNPAFSNPRVTSSQRGLSAYWPQIRSVFTSREQFKEFVKFVNPFRKK